MRLKQVVAGAAIGCALGVTGITMSTGIANAAPGQCPPNVQCQGPGPQGPGPQGGFNGPAGPQAPRNDPRPPNGGGPAGPPQGWGGPGNDRGGPPPDFRDRGPGGPPGDWRGPGGPPGDRGPDGPPPGDFNRAGDHDWRPPWNPQDNDWRGRFHGAPWGDGLPPWGWGSPPPPVWDGPLPPAWGLPPPPINYYGFNEQPVWDAGYNLWGFYFFGIWIPLPL